MKLLLILVNLVLSLASTSYGATYYLKPDTGLDSNNGTSTSSPWKTMHKIKTTVVAGDIVNVMGGTFIPSQYQGESGIPAWTETQSQGTANNPITVQALAGQIPIFNGQRQDWWMLFEPHNGINPTTPRYVIIRGLEFTNFTSAVIGVTAATNVTIDNCYFHDLYDTNTGTLVTGPADKVIFSNNRFFNIGDTTFGYNLTGDHPIYIGEGSTHIVMDGNTIEKAAGYGIISYGHLNYTLESQNLIIRRNTLVNTHQGQINDTGGTTRNVYIYNNTMYGENIAVFPQVDSLRTMSFGTFHGTGNMFATYVLNNIGYGYTDTAAFYADTSSQFNSDLLLDYNLWVNLTDGNKTYNWNNTNYTFTNFKAATGRDTHSLNSNPLFTNPSSRDFTLASGSPAINAGTTLTTTTTSGTNSTILNVADSGFFHDGYGMVQGDIIRIGSQTATIRTINSSTSITLTEARTWSSGATVSLEYNGNAPDMGANESNFAPPPPPTNIYYVSKSGSDSNSCSTAQNPNGGNPKLTVTNAINNCLSSGRTIQVRSGTYVEQLTNHDGRVNWPTCSSGSPCTLQNYPGESPVIQGNNFTVTMFLNNPGNGALVNYIIFDGLEFFGGGIGEVPVGSTFTCCNVFTIQADNITVQNSNIWGANANLIEIGRNLHTNPPCCASDNIKFINNLIHDAYTAYDANLWPQCGNQPCTTGQYCMYGHPANSLFDGNTFYGCRGIALHLYWGDCYSCINHNTISNNIFHDNTTTDGQRHSTMMPIIDYGDNELYYNNVFYHNCTGYGPCGGDITIHGNNISVYNNTIYNTDGTGILQVAGTGTIARGNIIYQHLKLAIEDASGLSNTYSNNFIDVNPSFVSSTDLHLNTGSAALGACPNFSSVFNTDKDGVARSSGSNWACGAYELAGSPPPPDPSLPAPSNLRVITNN